MNLLFDLDGTLTDPFEGITRCIEYALVTLGRPAPERDSLKWCIGPPLQKSLAELLDTEDDRLAQRALALYRERFSSTGLFENTVYNDIPPVLGSLKNLGYDLYVATAKPFVYARQIIEHFDLLPYFTKVYGSELDGTRTDKSDLISYILKQEKLDPARTVMIGDRKHDIIGAKVNNVSAIGVLWGYGTEQEMAAYGADTIVTQPCELVAELDLLRQ